MDTVNSDLVGEIWSPGQPFNHSSQYGQIDFSPEGEFEVRSLQTFKLVYTAGPCGMDDTGSLKIVFRFPLDIGGLQTTDPTKINYVSAKTSNGAKLTLGYNPVGHMRPRDDHYPYFCQRAF